MPKFISILCFVFAILFSDTSLGMQPPPRHLNSKPQSAPAATEEPTNLSEPGLGDKVTDRRFRFSKKWQSELGVFGGDYLGDEWLNTWDAGAHYYLHINHTFAIGAAYTYSRIRASANSSFGGSLTNNNEHILNTEVAISNDCAFRSGKTIVECDLFLTLGGGAVQINSQWKPLAIVGGGMKIYLPPPYLAIRFDVNSYLHPTAKPDGDAFNADIGFNLGLSFLFSQRKIE